MFKLKSAFVTTGRDTHSDKPEKINISTFLTVDAYEQDILDDKIEFKFFSLFVSRGLSFFDTQTEILKTQSLRNK